MKSHQISIKEIETGDPVSLTGKPEDVAPVKHILKGKGCYAVGAGEGDNERTKIIPENGNVTVFAK